VNKIEIRYEHEGIHWIIFYGTRGTNKEVSGWVINRVMENEKNRPLKGLIFKTSAQAEMFLRRHADRLVAIEE